MISHDTHTLTHQFASQEEETKLGILTKLREARQRIHLGEYEVTASYACCSLALTNFYGFRRFTRQPLCICYIETGIRNK